MKRELLTISIILIGMNIFAQLDNGLIAKYYFNNGNANDESGNGYNADTVTSVLTIDRCDNANYAYSFDGTQFIDIPYSSPFNVNELSVSVWFKVLNGDTASQRIITLPVGEGSGDQHFSVIYNSHFGSKRVMIYFDPGPVYSASSDTVNDSQWHHYVGTISTSNSEVKSYLDGIPEDTTSFSGAPKPAFGNLQIGRFSSVYDQNFIGNIDDIRIYNRVLLASEVDSLYQQSCVFTDISSLKPEISFSVFPNPSTNIFTLKNNSNHSLQFTLYNSLGEIIIDKTLIDNTSTIDLSASSDGIYFYKLTSENNLIKTGKLIKQ
jgi:hypothetical protein